MKITVKRLAELLFLATHQPLTQCLVTVKRRARQYGYRREVPLDVARHIMISELRAAGVRAQPHESLLVI